MSQSIEYTLSVENMMEKGNIFISSNVFPGWVILYPVPPSFTHYTMVKSVLHKNFI